MRRDAGPEFPEPTGLSGSYFRGKFRVRLSHPPYCPSGHRIYPCGPETKNGVDTRGGGDERRGRSDRQHQDARLRLVCWALRVRPPRHLRRVARRRRRADLPVRGPAVWDEPFLRAVLEELGVLAPVLFIALQTLQVIMSPIPGEATGFLGGYLFGEWLGLCYSTIGLTIRSLASL